MDKKQIKNIISVVVALAVVCGIVVFAYNSGKKVGAESVSIVEPEETSVDWEYHQILYMNTLSED